MPRIIRAAQMALLVALTLPLPAAPIDEPAGPNPAGVAPGSEGLSISWLAGLRGGWTSFIDSENRAVGELSVGALARFHGVGAGIQGHGGQHGDVRSEGADVVVGPSWGVGSGRRLDVLATVGVQYFDLAVGRSRFLVGSDLRGGNALFPVYGLKLATSPDDANGFTLGLYVVRTFRDVDAPYQEPECRLGVCTWTEVPRRYGGTVVGVVLQYGWTSHYPRRAPAGSEAPPPPRS